MQLVGSHRGLSKQMPAAGTGQTLHAGLHAADRDGARRRQQPGVLPPRHLQRVLQAAEIRPSRRKTDHGDAVVAGDMPGHDIVGRGVERFGDVLEIDAMLAAIDHGNAPAPRVRDRRHRQLGQRDEFLSQRLKTDLQGIVMDQQGTIGRHRLGHADDGFRRQRAIERQHALIGRVVDVAAEFHRDGAVAARQNTGRGRGRGHGLKLIGGSRGIARFVPEWNSLRAK